MTMPVATPCTECGAECCAAGMNDDEPCWGEVRPNYDGVDEDGFEICFHYCEGHQGRAEGGVYVKPLDVEES